MQNSSAHEFKAIGRNIHGQRFPDLDFHIGALEVKWMHYAPTKMLTESGGSSTLLLSFSTSTHTIFALHLCGPTGLHLRWTLLYNEDPCSCSLCVPPTSSDTE